MGMTRDKMEFAAILAKELPGLNAIQVVTVAQKFVRYAATYQHLQETACNRELTETEKKKEARLEAKIDALAITYGLRGVKLGGDPRGCTVKLVARSGYTNDWGREGICVPTS